MKHNDLNFLTMSRIFFGKDLGWSMLTPSEFSLNTKMRTENDKLYLSVERENRKLGSAVFINDELEDLNILESELAEFSEFLAGIFFADELVPGSSARMVKVAEWLHELKSEHGQIIDWAGIYFKQKYFDKKSASRDLVLGPFLGKSTTHVRIGLHEGFCGLALSEERVINVKDVRSDSRHIACSLSTQSELVIPLKGKDGEYFAELDLDSNTLNAFSGEMEEEMKKFAESFPMS